MNEIKVSLVDFPSFPTTMPNFQQKSANAGLCGKPAVCFNNNNRMAYTANKYL